MNISILGMFFQGIALFFIVSFIIALFEWGGEIKEARKKLAGGETITHECGLIVRNENDLRSFRRIRFRAVFLRAFVRPVVWLPAKETHSKDSS